MGYEDLRVLQVFEVFESGGVLWPHDRRRLDLTVVDFLSFFGAVLLVGVYHGGDGDRLFTLVVVIAAHAHLVLLSKVALDEVVHVEWLLLELHARKIWLCVGNLRPLVRAWLLVCVANF